MTNGASYDPMTLGKRIKRLRLSKNLTIKDLADASKINKNTIVRLEKGENRTSLNTVFRICDALDVSFSMILEGKPVENSDYIRHERKIETGLRKDRKPISKGPVSIGDLSLHLNGGLLNAGILEVTGRGEKNSHTGEELLFCLTGKVEVDINGQIIVLNKGDGLVFWGTEPHSYSHVDGKKDKTVCLSVVASREIEKLEDLISEHWER